MGIADDISVKRQLLSAFRMRFAPEVQQAKEAVIDSVVEHMLFAADVGATIDEIKEHLNKSFRVNILNRDLLASTQRLMEKGTVESYEEALKGVKLKGRKKILHKLSAAARKRIENSEREAINRFDSVCERLFKDSKIGWNAYVEPFLKFLSFVFARLAEENIRMIRGDIAPSQLIASPAFSSALNSIKRSLKSLDTELFESAAISFFRDPDPDYAAIKWNMAQNYYVLKVIGLDRQALLLSRDVFKNADFYLDTNVVISALEPQESHHRTFLTLCEVCQRLGIEVRVCNITLEELDRVVIANRDMLQKVVDQIPEETAVKVSSNFYEVYYEKKKSGEVFDLDAVFENFSSAGDKLKDSYKIEIYDNGWFDQVKYEDRTSDFAREIAERYISMRKRRKYDLAANHDSLCMLWIEELRRRGNANTWFVTRDYTLPGCIPKDCDYKSLAITMDALIQWLLPVDISAGEEKDIASTYSDMISSRILPQERIFNLEDFIIFHELEMTCRELPAEDVEGCIRYIKQNIPLLNPSDPADREKFARAIAVYFADPSRKYLQNVERFESEIVKLKGEVAEQKVVSLRKDAWLKISHIAIIFLILEIIVVAVTSVYGSGENTFQKIMNSWAFVVTPIPLCIVFGWFYLGKQRLRALGWPITKIFKD